MNKAIAQNGLPEKVVIDGSHAHRSALDAMNVQLWLTVYFMLCLIEICSIKYLNNIVEQSHRWVKQKTRQALGWKSVEGATASLHGREMWAMLKRGQIEVEGDTACEKFYALSQDKCVQRPLPSRQK